MLTWVEAMPDARSRLALDRAHACLPGALVFLVLVLLALQRGGYYAESWALPTAACGWIAAVIAMLADRQRLRRLELVLLCGMGLLALLALVSSTWAPGGLGSALPHVQLLVLMYPRSA